MSYVDLFSNDRWTEQDHVSRTQALVRSVLSADEEEILNRDVLGAITGMGAPMSPELMERAMWAKGVLEAARLAGVEGRADAALLNAVLDYEEAVARGDEALPELAAPAMALYEERLARRPAEEVAPPPIEDAGPGSV